MENIPNGFNNSPEKLSKKFFEDFIEIQEDIKKLRIYLLSESSSEKNTLSLVEEIKSKYKGSFSQLGVSIFFEKEFEVTHGEDNLYVKFGLKFSDLGKFNKLLQNLPKDFLRKDNEYEFTEGIGEILDKEIYDFYESKNPSDNIYELVKYSNSIRIKLYRLFSKKKTSKQKEVIKFLKEYENAFKEGYLVELCTIYFKRSLIPYVKKFKPKDLYYYYFFNNENEVTDEESLKTSLSDVKYRMNQIKAVLNIIRPEIIHKQIFKEVISNLKREFQSFAGVSSYIKNPRLKREYNFLLKETEIMIKEKLEILKKSSSKDDLNSLQK